MTKILLKARKIIHVDMDCFFAAVEMRDNPSLKNKPVAIGGTPEQRGVLSTCNYEARKYGLHSAMPTTQALKLCPKLVLLSVNMSKYKAASKVLYRIFRQYTPLVEMLSLDEAFLDVTNCQYCKGSATLIAKTIKNRIKKELNLTSSAGVASNKFLAKVASDWNKPDGLFVITPNQVADFVKHLPVTKIFGVGKVTAKRLHNMQIKTCLDLQNISLSQLVDRFGKMGERFYYLCRGVDDRLVESESVRKSLSVEETFPRDLKTVEECLSALVTLIQRLKRNLLRESNLLITKQFVKIKFCDFKMTTAEITKKDEFVDQTFFDLFKVGFNRYNKPIRLLGVGVRFGKQVVMNKTHV
jgi:DNA polymerase IV